MNSGYECYLSRLFQEGVIFFTLEKQDGGLVLMGDDHTYRMEGIYTILIKMMVRELKDVRFVPQLKKKLISIGLWMHRDLKGLLKMSFSRYSKV